MTQRTLIAFQTKTGATAEYASIIAGVLTGEFDHEVDIIDLRTSKVPELTLYDNVVIGSGIRIGRLYGRPKRLFKDKRLGGKRVAVFLASGEAGEAPEGTSAKYEQKICQKYHHFKPLACNAFGGVYPKAKMDYRDPEMARAWAMRLGELLKKE